MREILFRGKTKAGEWVFGCYISTGCDAPAIVWGDGVQAEVDPETVGQYTGRKDMYGLKIFDGDNLEVYQDFRPSSTGGVKTFIVQNHVNRGYPWNTYLLHMDKARIIGNIHDNPELVESEE
ncbi:YopX family protein [Paremcibacter congregatus]|uniref:YopX family protein n=1 Tax=Paremcibacter congregatus TaxID=2043170 RepID=UPI0030EDAEDB